MKTYDIDPDTYEVMDFHVYIGEFFGHQDVSILLSKHRT